jgi:hypothetical protein
MNLAGIMIREEKIPGATGMIRDLLIWMKPFANFRIICQTCLVEKKAALEAEAVESV